MVNRRTFVGASAAAAAGLLLDRIPRFAQTKDAPGSIVETTLGKIRGLTRDRVEAFKGVPYAASTTGARRFMPPAKADPWSGVRDAFALGHRSPQGRSVFVPE